MDYSKHIRRSDQSNIDSSDLRPTGYHTEARLRRPNSVSNQEPFIDIITEQTNTLSLSDNLSFIGGMNAGAGSVGSGGCGGSGGGGDSNTQHLPPREHQSHHMTNNSNTLWSGGLSAINTINTINTMNTINTSSIANTISTTSSTQSSILSPFAKEFVPRTPVCHTIGSNSSITSLSNGVPIWTNHSDAKNPSSESLLQHDRDFDDYIALSYLREFIDTITIKPNRYDNGITYLTEVINSYIDEDDSVMSAVVNAIVDQAIIDPQFRYNGVRLCIYFMEHLRAVTPDSTFKLFLFRRCHREHARRECLIKSSEESENYLRGLTMFIGDLYARCSAYELAEYLPQLLITLMSNPHKENLKCICQVLKLCGSNLEEYYREKDAKDMSGGTNVNYMTVVMDQLKCLTNNTDVDAYAKELITNIIDMQTRGWTANIISSTAAANSAVNPYLNNSYNDNNCVSYGDYYEEYNSYSDEDEFHTSYDFGQCGDEDDNEVCEAFEEFLKNSGQTNRN